MTDDIVTRLRDDYQKTVELCAEAADVIETMRQQTDDWKKIIVQKDRDIEKLRAVLKHHTGWNDLKEFEGS